MKKILTFTMIIAMLSEKEVSGGCLLSKSICLSIARSSQIQYTVYLYNKTRIVNCDGWRDAN